MALQMADSDDTCSVANIKPKPPYCCNEQIRSEVVNNNNDDGTCTFDYKIKLVSPNCTKKEDINGECEKIRNGKFYCLAEDTIYTSSLDNNCGCVDVPTKQYRTCCCKGPENFETCDKLNGIKETIDIRYELIQDTDGYKCDKIEVKKSRKVNLKKFSIIRKGICNNNNGYRTDIKYQRYRDGCEIKEKMVESISTVCACPRNEITEPKCVNNNKLVNTTTIRRLDCCQCYGTCSCVPIVIAVMSQTIACPKSSLTKSKCTYSGNNRLITKINYNLKDCICTEKKTSHLEKCKDCKYKQLNETISKCCQCTGTEKVTTFYRDVDCRIKEKIEKRECTCRDTPPNPKTFCTKGISYTENYYYIFSRKVLACIIRYHKIYNPITCNPEKVIKGKCGEGEKYYYKTTTIKHQPNNKTCICEPVHEYKNTICECPVKETTEWKCVQNDRLTRSNISFQINLLRNKCDKKIETTIEIKVCNVKIPKKIVKVNRCEYIVHKYFSYVQNCKCKVREKTKPKVVCCLREPSIEYKCQNNNKRITSITTYKVNCDKTKCEPVISTNVQVIVCNSYLVISQTPCVDGKYFIIKKHYRVKNCKCIKTKTQKIPVIIPCNTGKPHITNICQNTCWNITTTTWKIKNCQCISNSKSIIQPKECPETVRKYSRCNRKTGKVTVNAISYVIQNCKCVPKKESYKIPCPCFKKDKIEKTKCFSMKRIVNKLRYTDINGTCHWKVLKTESEDCECEEDRSQTQCYKNAFQKITTISFILKLVHLKLPVNRCFERRTCKITPIICCKDSTYMTPCKDYQQSVITCKYVVTNCKCTKVCRTKCIRACNCKIKNKSETKCENNKLNRYVYSYKDNGKHCGCECQKSVAKCVESISIINIPISCPQPTKPITSTPCIFLRNNGYYRKITTTKAVIKDCKCILESKTEMKLCRCICQCTFQTICRSNTLIAIRTIYIRKGNKCVTKVLETIKKLHCLPPSIKIKETDHYTEYTLIYYTIVNCKCIRKEEKKRNDKCNVAIPNEKICSNQIWILIEYKLTQKYSTIKLFKNIPSSPYVSHCVKNTKKSTILISCGCGYVTKCCDVKTKRLTITTRYYNIEKCVCVLKSKVKVERCRKCPCPTEKRGKCGPSDIKGFGYRDLTITMYELTTRNKCKKIVKHRREICRCPKQHSRSYCKDGKLITEETGYTLTSNPPCKPLMNLKEKDIYCYNFGKENSWKLFRTDKCDKPGDFTIARYEREVFNSALCDCRRVEKSAKIQMCCKSCTSEIKCINNVKVKETTCWKPIRLHCYSIKQPTPLEMECPPSTRTPIGKVINCIQKYIVKSYSIINCVCVSKTTPESKKVCCKPCRKRVKICIGKRWKIEITNFLFKRGECIPKLNIEYEDICDCKCVRTFKDEKIDEYTFWRFYYKKVLINCVCELKLYRKKKLCYKCHPPKTVVTCKDDKIIVTTTKTCVFCDFHCRTRTLRSLVTKDCSNIKLLERVQTGTCKVKDTFYSIVYKNCNCERKILKEENNEICCYHLKPYNTKVCNSKDGIFTVTYYNYKVVDNRCLKYVEKKSIKPISCKEKDCKTVVEPCIKNTNIVKLICLKRVKCKCITEVKESRQCCKPESYEWRKVGLCKGCYRIIKYYAFRFDKVSNICKAVVTRVQKKLCRCCETPLVTKTCIKDVYIKKISITYTLNEEKEACTKCVKEEMTSIKGCSKKSKKVRIISKVCNHRTGWGTEITEYVRANKCECERFRRAKQYICICQVAYPPKERNYCRDNRILVKEIKTAKCLKRKICGCYARHKTLVTWTTREIITPILGCEKVVIEKGNCFPTTDGYATHIRYVSKIQYMLVNCTCVSKVIYKRKEHCECQKSFVETKCKDPQEIITTVMFNIINGICRRSSTIKTKLIPCPSKPKVTTTKCLNNKYKKITKIFFRQNCKCLYKICEKTCDCVCPATTVETKCTKAYFIDEITTTWRKVDCLCVKNVIVRPLTPKCPYYQNETISPCIKTGESGYKKITTRKLTQNREMCKCEIEECHKYKICWCKKNPKTIEICQNNDTIIIETWKTLINIRSNRCKRVRVSICTRKMSCPKKVVKINCNKLTGVYVKKIYIYYISNCTIKKTKKVIRGDCKCPTEIKIKRGVCSNTTCKRTDIFISQILVKIKCVTVKKPETFICCCNPKFKYKRYCQNNRLLNSTTEYILKDQKCNPKENITEIGVFCIQVIIVEQGECNANGVKIIREYRYVSRNCVCVKEKIREYYCKCKCGKTQIKYSCNTFAKLETKTIIQHLLIDCKCIARINKTRRTITCPEDKTDISNCKEERDKDYSIRKIKTTKYEINNDCKCIPKVYLEKEICCCKRKKTVIKVCDKINHIMTITTSYTILKNKQCQRRTKIRKLCKCCGSGKWILKGTTNCLPDNSYGQKVLTYVRQVNFECSCKEEVKQKHCHCICEGPPQKQSCENNQIKHIFYSYTMIKCKCVVKVTKIYFEDIKCKRLPPIHVPCKKGYDGVFRKYTIYRDRKIEQCKCVTVERKESCVCKCQPSFTVKRCENNMFLFINTSFKKTCTGCIPQNERRSEPIPCSPPLECRLIKKCHGKRKQRQIHECIEKKLENCQCKVTKKRFKAKCWCKKPVIQKGPCDNITCLREIKTFTTNLIIGSHNETKCVTVISVANENCCCIKKGNTTEKCEDNVLTNKIVKYVFVDVCKSCRKIVKVINITPKCFPKKSISNGKCKLQFCLECETVTHKSLVNCKCQTTQQTYCIKCRKNFSQKKCQPNNNFNIKSFSFILIEGKCIRKITNKIEVICCPEKTSRYVTECNPLTRTRVKEITSYRKQNCKCLPIIVRKDEICRCLPPSTNETCIAESGVIRRITVSYTLDMNKHECLLTSLIVDRTTCCNTKPITNCDGCEISYKCGMYKRCVTTTGVRKGCRCFYPSKIHYRLCYCPKPTNENICYNNDMSAIKNTFYVRIKSRSNFYNFECLKKTKNVNVQKITCPKSTITKGCCLNNRQIYTTKYYVVNNCECIMKIRKDNVRCGCPKPKEIKKTCMFQSRWDITIRTYKLICNKKRIPNCNCVHFDRIQMKLVECEQSTYEVGSCIHNRRQITYTDHKSINCNCETSKRIEYVNCECRGRKSEIPLCKLSKLCKNELYLKYKCQFTCGYCETCPKCSSRVSGPCKCKKIAGINLCSRLTIITKYTLQNRRCIKNEYEKQSMCGCSINNPKEECQKLRKEGLCKDPKVMRKCEFICSDFCRLCQGIFKRVKCINSGKHKGYNRIVTITFNKECDSCFAKTSVKYEKSLKPCELFRKIYITECIHNVRYVVTIYITMDSITYKETRTPYSCKDCCSSTETKIGECSNGYRTVLTVFWANINNYCRKQTIINVYSCNPLCNTISYVRSQCLNNKQLVSKVWRSGDDCKSHSASETTTCVRILT